MQALFQLAKKLSTYVGLIEVGKNVQRFCEQYKEDMPNIDIISQEIDNWESL